MAQKKQSGQEKLLMDLRKLIKENYIETETDILYEPVKNTVARYNKDINKIFDKLGIGLNPNLKEVCDILSLSQELFSYISDFNIHLIYIMLNKFSNKTVKNTYSNKEIIKLFNNQLKIFTGIQEVIEE